ncbi:MAG: serine/threonine protein kinase [Prevotella sp.]|nr:serine/threonine protein kinase [Prevotella sp.]
MKESSMLRVGTVLRGIYRIDKYLSSGGFGNTYVGYNLQFDERIAIKEFFMKGVTARDDNQTSVSISNQDNNKSFLEQNEKFRKEAKRLRKLSNPHIVGVHDLFEENGTSYYVMDFIDGENLAERMKRTGEPLSEKEVWDLLPQILDALKAVHAAGLWHLDLKPGNIMVDKSGNAKLIDFGASKQLNAQKGGATASTAAVSYTNGFAPREQMEQNYEKFGPWTDIYALGATLFNLLTNKLPPLPSDIDDDDSEDKHEALPLGTGVSERMRNLILWMMNTNRGRRPQSIDALIDYCEGKKKSEHPITPPNLTKGVSRPVMGQSTTNTPTNKQTNDGGNSKLKYAIISCIIACITCVGVFWLVGQPEEGSEDGKEKTENITEVSSKDVSAIVVVFKSADKIDYFVLTNKEGTNKVATSELNYTPSDEQVDITVSSNQEMNQSNKIDALLEKIHSKYNSSKVFYIAQQTLSVDPSMQLIDKKLKALNINITYYNPSKYSVNETAMVEEFVNQQRNI